MSTERLGASFSIDTTRLKAGLTEANRLIRESKSEFEKAAAGVDKFGKSQEGIEAKITHLNNVQDLQQKKVDGLRKAYQENVSKGLDPMSAAMVKMRTDLNKEEAALKQTESELKDQTKALENVKKETQENSTVLGRLKTAFKDSGDAADKAAKGGFTVAKGALANLVADGVRKAISALKELSSQVIETGKDFTASMSQVAAVSGATGKELEALEQKAKEMGATTKFTASEAADAFNYMAMAGWKTEEMLGGIDGILSLAAASGTDLATTSDIVTDALTAMGYSAADAGRLADVMAAASSNANTNVEMMGATFQYAAPLVGALGYSMEDTAVAIGLMANAGIKGEKAGTALRSVFTRLAAPPKAAATSLNELGISITDNDGKMKSFETVIEDLRKAFDGLSETEQAQHAANIAGQEAMSGLLAIVNAAPADFEKLKKAVAESDGAALQMSKTMQDNLTGDLIIMQSALEGVKLELYSGLEPNLRSATQTITNKFVPAISKNVVPAVKKFFSQLEKDKTVEKFGKQALNLAKTVLPPLANAIKFVAEHIGTLAKVALTAVTAFQAFNAAMKVSAAITAATTAVSGLTTGVGLATKAQTVWNAVMSANPIGAVITAVALLAGGIALLISEEEKAKEATEFLSESQRESVTAAEEAAEAYKETKAAADELAGSQIANVNYVKDNLLPTLSNLVDSNGKVKKGEEERAEFIMGQLRDALGNEKLQLGDIFDANGKIKDSIYDVIEAKKAQILLSAYEESYKEAIENVANAEKARAAQAQELALQEELVEQKRSQYLSAKQAAEEAYDGRTKLMYEERASRLHGDLVNEEKILNDKKAAYTKSESDLYGYYSDISGYETASTLVMKGETTKALGYLNDLGSGFETAASTAKLSAEEQKKILGQQVVDTEVNAQLMEDAYKKGVEGVSKEMVATAKAQAEKAKEEFKTVGGDITKGIAEGAEKEEWTLSSAMKGLIDKALAAARKAADSHSPSRRFKKKVGITIPQGIAVGIDDGTKDVIKSVNRQVNAIQRAYDVGDISATVNKELPISKSSTENQNASAVANKNVTVNQNNYYSQAHSRYELYKSKQQTAAAVRLALQGV